MKWWRYPLSVVAYLLTLVFLMVVVWMKFAGKPLPVYWYYFPAGTAVYLLCSFILSKLRLQWELSTFIQVALILVPVFWYVNNPSKYKPPVYVFVTEAGYTGKIEISFADEKDTIHPLVRSFADTLYFRFDDGGKLFLNEDYYMVREAMHKRFYYHHPDGSLTRIKYFEKNQALPSDTLTEVLVEDSATMSKSRVRKLFFRLNYPQKLK